MTEIKIGEVDIVAYLLSMIALVSVHSFILPTHADGEVLDTKIQSGIEVVDDGEPPAPTLNTLQGAGSLQVQQSSSKGGLQGSGNSNSLQPNSGQSDFQSTDNSQKP